MNFRIKKLLLLMLTLLTFAQNSPAEIETRFRAGVVAYQNGEFALASQAFRDSLAKQPASGTLLNLGLAEWHQGRTGEAMLAWEKAAWLDPFSREVRDNLLYARETFQVSPPELTWFEQASTWLPANFWTWIAGGSLWLAVGMVTVAGIFSETQSGLASNPGGTGLGHFSSESCAFHRLITRSQSASSR